MKFDKKLSIALVLGYIFILSITMTPSILAEEKLSTTGVPSIMTTEPPREETVWMTGSYISGSEFLPWSSAMHPGTDCMYESLFGWNDVKVELIPCIGTSYSWSATGDSITIDLNPNARWSDGETVDAEDVVYSYELAQAQGRYTADFEDRFESYNVVDADTVRFDLNSGYYNSRQVIFWITRNIPIVPKHVWTEIVAEHGTDVVGDVGELGTYQYDWFDSDDVPDEWKVISGPYAPVYRDATEATTAYQYRDNWWGAGIIYQDIPNAVAPPPRYIGQTNFATNTEQDLAFIQGDIDLYAGYYHHIWDIWEEAEVGDPGYYVSTWYGHEAPYISAVSSLMNLGINHLYPNSPLGIKEFRQALAYGINYEPIPMAAASGYWTQAKPGFIDDNSAAHAPYYDASITTANQKSLDVATAVSLLESIPGMSGSVEAGWTYNGHPVGPYESIVPIGWSDAIIFQEMVCADITANLGITIESTQVDFGLVWMDAINNNDYAFSTYCVGSRIENAPHTFLKTLRGRHDTWTNATNWQNAEFDTLWQELESASETDYAANVDRLQEILAEEVPEIPCFVNGYWYAYSEYYWEGWTSEANKFQQVCTTWATDMFAIKTRLFLNLTATGAGRGIVIPWFGLEICVLLGIVSTVVITGFRLKTKRE
jgi:peptide/nickel transport system substrate-binding protein